MFTTTANQKQFFENYCQKEQVENYDTFVQKVLTETNSFETFYQLLIGTLE